MMNTADYKKMTPDEKRVLVDWYQKSSEALGVLKANGLSDVQALKMLRSGLTVKNLKHLDK